MLSYFCGYGPGCSDPKSVVSLQKAKMAVEQQYSVVGVSEMRNISLRVMEAFLPKWFRGATSMEVEEKREMVNSHPEPGEEATAEMKRRLELDYDFYQFCIQRLQIQWKTISSDHYI